MAIINTLETNRNIENLRKETEVTIKKEPNINYRTEKQRKRNILDGLNSKDDRG